jgi:hypothetical protein
LPSIKTSNKAAPEFDAETFTRQPERCWHPFLSLLYGRPCVLDRIEPQQDCPALTHWVTTVSVATVNIHDIRNIS